MNNAEEEKSKIQDVIAKPKEKKVVEKHKEPNEY